MLCAGPDCLLANGVSHLDNIGYKAILSEALQDQPKESYSSIQKEAFGRSEDATGGRLE